MQKENAPKTSKKNLKVQETQAFLIEDTEFANATFGTDQNETENVLNKATGDSELTT